MEIPDAGRLAELKAKDSEAHKMFLRQSAAQLKHQRFMESARYKMPMKTIRGNQIAALAALAMLTALAFAGVIAGYPWLAALFGVLDVLGIVGLFLDPFGANRDDDPGKRD